MRAERGGTLEEKKETTLIREKSYYLEGGSGRVHVKKSRDSGAEEPEKKCYVIGKRAILTIH